MGKVPVEFGEWRPDVALLDTKFATEAFNVFAGVNSYLPFPSLKPMTTFVLGDPVTDPVCGFFSARTTSGQWKIYAGTKHHLWTWTPTGWTDLTRAAGGNYNVATGDLWMWEQSGTHVVAVNAADNPQWIDVNSGSAVFANLPGSPPKATNVKQIGDFLFLSGLAEAGTFNNRMIAWSAINDITGWTAGTNLSDVQEFPDCGPVMGVSGAEIGYVLQERGIRTMQFLPGDTTFIFNFSRVLHDRGSMSKYGFCCIGNVLYFVSEDGFYSVTGQQVQPIGSDKVNDWWLKNSDAGRRNVVLAIAGINKPRIVWAYHTFSGTTVYNHVIVFDWSNSRWVHAEEFAWVWGLLSSLGLDLDTTGTEPGDVDIDSTALDLDNFAYLGGRPLIGAINQDGLLCSIDGPPLRAVVETAEVHLVPGLRAFVSEAYPLGDAPAETVAAFTRERLQDAPALNPPVPLEKTGAAALFSSSRLHRFQMVVPAGQTWTHAQGVLIERQQDGTVA